MCTFIGICRGRDGSLVCKILSFVLPVNVFNFSQNNLQNVKTDQDLEVMSQILSHVASETV